MKEIVNKFSLARDKLMPAMDNLDLHIFFFGLFTKNNEIIQKFKETEDSRYIYQNEIDKACF